MSNLVKEINSLVTSIVVNSGVILERRDKEQTKKLKELFIGFGLKLDEWNSETFKLLKDNKEHYDKALSRV